MDVAPCQMVGVSAGLIPFLEHDDANRALMGSNMQRQAVPLLRGGRSARSSVLSLERAVAENSGMLIKAEKSGTVNYVDATRIEVDGRIYPMQKFTGLNERTCMNQKPIIKLGQDESRRDRCCAIARDHANWRTVRWGTVLVAFMSWERLQLRRCDHSFGAAGERAICRFLACASKSSTSKFAKPSSAVAKSSRARHTERQRERRLQTPGRRRHRAGGDARPRRATFSSVSSRYMSQGRTDPRRKAAARDLRPGHGEDVK